MQEHLARPAHDMAAAERDQGVILEFEAHDALDDVECLDVLMIVKQHRSTFCTLLHRPIVIVLY